MLHNFIFRGHFSDFSAEISPFTSPQTNNIHRHGLKTIAFSLYQTYMIIEVIPGHTEGSVMRQSYIILFSGVILVIFRLKFRHLPLLK